MQSWPGEDEACVDRALKMLKVKYKVLPAVLDYHTAKDNRDTGASGGQLEVAVSGWRGQSAEICAPTWRMKREMWRRYVCRL